MQLHVFGHGPAHEKLKKIAGSTIHFYTDRFGDASDEVVADALEGAKGFIFPAEEDFGIVSVEALAAGAPVIGLAKGGTTDIITSDELGVLFEHQTTDDVAEAITIAERRHYSPTKLARTAKRFDKTLFISKLKNIVAQNSPRA